MKDNEIIKVLERCSDGTGKGIIKATLDLIKSKDEQIEALIAGQETLQKALNEKSEENADLSIKLEKWLDKYNEKNIEIVKLSHNIQTAKSEAVKEFADLVVKNICEKVTPIPQQKYLINMCIQEIENTKKEMVGEG